jgi:hypothetical protein
MTSTMATLKVKIKRRLTHERTRCPLQCECTIDWARSMVHLRSQANDVRNCAGLDFWTKMWRAAGYVPKGDGNYMQVMATKIETCRSNNEGKQEEEKGTRAVP